MALGEYIILDLETTGLSKRRHNITEIAAVKYKDGKMIGEFQTLVNPGCHIPSFITRLTGIDDEMVKDAPSVDKVLPGLFDFLGDTLIVAHCATFDYGFIFENGVRHMDHEFSNERLCTRKLANRILFDLPSKKLGSLCEYFDVTNEAAHRAMGDVKATAEVFHGMLDILEEKGISSREEICEFESFPGAKCRKMLE